VYCRQDRDLQHPDITAAEATGYPDGYYRPVVTCAYCHQEISWHDDRIIGQDVVCQECYEAMRPILESYEEDQYE